MKRLLVILSLMCASVMTLAQQQTLQKETNHPVVLHPVSKNQYTNSLSFFCRKEWQLEKTIKLPVKIRVGNIEQCNYLEQKPGYTMLSK